MTKRTRKNTAAKSTASHSYIGRSIAREFDYQIYPGKIDNYYPRCKLWSVSYNAGDAEELYHGEMMLAMDLAKGNSDISYVSTRASPKFGRKICKGSVNKFDKKDYLRHITFDDGDEEELSHEGLLFVLDLQDSIDGQRKRKIL